MTRNEVGKITARGLKDMFQQLDPTAKFIVVLVLLVGPFVGAPTLAELTKGLLGGDATQAAQVDSVRKEFQAADKTLGMRMDSLSRDVSEIKSLQRQAIINDYLTSGVLTEQEIAAIQGKQQRQKLHSINLDSLGDIVTTRLILKQNNR